MNALSLYVTTCRMIFQAEQDSAAGQGAWSDINRLILYLRQALTCCVCGKLLTVPMSSTVSSCQHHVCKACVGGKMRLKPSCSWCKDHSKFIENTQLRILLQCYKRLCDFVSTSDIPNKWGNLAVAAAGPGQVASAANNNVVSGPSNLMDLIEEGSALSDKFSFSEPPLRTYSNRNSATAPSVVPVASSSNAPIQTPQIRVEPASKSNSVLNGDSNSSSDMSNVIALGVSNGNSTPSRKITPDTVSYTTTPSTFAGPSTSTIRLAVTEAKNAGTGMTNGSSSMSSVVNTASASVTVTPKVKPKRRGCRCGLATPNPGKLTCCGQRCPCYVDNKGCFECKCRGCRNPHRANTLPGSAVIPAQRPAVQVAAKSQASINSSHPNSNTTVIAVGPAPQTASVLTSVSASALLSPGLLLSNSSSVSPTLNMGASLLTAASPNSIISRSTPCTNATINFISSTSSSPTAAIVVGGHAVGNESLTLPFPKLDDMDDDASGAVSTATIGIGTDDHVSLLQQD